MTTMASCILYHGPSARTAALDEAYQMGRLIDDPLGDNGLKVDAARQVVVMLQSIPIGTEKGIVVVGPMDRATVDASDVLLKCIEEFDGRFVQPILWAHDIGGVSPTIRSRCLDRWAPQTDEIPDDDELVAAGYELVHAALENELWSIPTLVGKYLKGHKGGEHDLLRSAADALIQDFDKQKARDLWDRLRKVAKHRNPTAIEVISAFLPPLSEVGL